MFYCHVLQSQTIRRRYVGSCKNLTERIRRHNAGDSKGTKHGVPWVLLHSESLATRSGAAQRERYYKTGRGRDELARSCRAVAAATGRRFKSSRPDVAARIGKFGYI
jgi:putative endonuclease